MKMKGQQGAALKGLMGPHSSMKTTRLTSDFEPFGHDWRHLGVVPTEALRASSGLGFGMLQNLTVYRMTPQHWMAQRRGPVAPWLGILPCGTNQTKEPAPEGSFSCGLLDWFTTQKGRKNPKLRDLTISRHTLHPGPLAGGDTVWGLTDVQKPTFFGSSATRHNFDGVRLQMKCGITHLHRRKSFSPFLSHK